MRKALASWRLDASSRVVEEDDGSTSITLLIPAGMELDDVIERLMAQLREVDTALEAAGIPPLPPRAADSPGDSEPT